MGNPGPLVLDISSDEETVFGDATKSGGGGQLGDKEDGDWLSKLLVEVGGNIDDGSDDVVFLSELFPTTLKKSRSDSVKPSAKVAVDEEGDDDCVVLDGDPDNPVVVVNNEADGDDSDDLEIVGEKGEVACRDFPHPRHLCAKYLFASTPHEVHCGQCHCYVCDSLAPCLHWGTGVSSIDHCHASDKEEYWKTERKHVKKSDKPLAVCSTVTTSIESFFQSIQVPGCAPSLPNSLPQNQGLKPVTIRPCALLSNVSMQNAMNRVSSQTPGYVAPRYNHRSHLASVQSHPRSSNTVASRVSPRSKFHHVGSQNPQSSHRPVFKRSGLVGASTNNMLVHRPQLSRDPPLNRRPAFQAPVTNGRHGSNQHMFGSQAAGLSSHHNTDARRANYLPSEPQINSQPYSSCRNPAYILHQSQMPSQPSVNGSSLGLPPLQPYTYTKPSAGNANSSVAPEPYIAFAPNNCVPSQGIDSWQSDAGNTFPDQLHSRSIIAPCSIVGNDSTQLQKQSNLTSSLTCGQNDVQHQHHTQSGMSSSPADFGLFCDSSVNHGNMQIHAEQSQYPDGAQVQNIQHAQPSITPMTLDNPLRQSAEVASINEADCQFPESREPGSFDFHFLDSWMFENQSFTGAVEAAASSNWNVYSPETAFADTGTMFDI